MILKENQMELIRELSRISVELKLTEGKKIKVILSDLFIFQDNSDLDKKWINKLVTKIKNGDELEPLMVLKITKDLQKQLKKLKDKLSNMPTHKKYADTIDDELLVTKKKWILLDGNHRFEAAKQAGVTALSAEEENMDAEEYVDYINSEF
jgi:hypothetical protein